MIRKLVAFTLICALTTVCHAESLDELYTSLIKQKREQISRALNLKDNSAFWEVYDKYEEKQAQHDNDAFNLIKKFNAKIESGSIEVQSMINMQAEFFRIEGRKSQTKQNQAEFFGYTLSKEDMFRFYQIDSKIDALIRSKIAEKMPLIAADVKID